MHRRELEAARSAEAPHAQGYLRADFEREGIRWRVTEGELDLFGDGAVRLLETPGHSAGHMSLLLEPAQTGPVLLTADAADNRRQWDGLDHPRALHAREQAQRSLRRLREVAAERDALIVFGHDPANWGHLRHAPARYL